MECMTCSLATRYRRDLDARYPLACSRIARRFFRPWTLLFTRGMSKPFAPLPAEEPADALRLGADISHAADAPLPAARLLDEHVVPGRLAVQDLPGPGHPEPFGCAPVGLHLRHASVPSLVRTGMRNRPALLRRLGRSLGLGFLRRRPRHRTLDGRQNHHHVPPIQLRIGLYGSKFLEISREVVQESSAQLRVGHLPAPEHDGDLDPGPRLEEPDDVPLLDPVVVRIDLGAHLDLLDFDTRLSLPGFLLLDGSLVLELAVVHDAAHGRLGLR